MNRFLIGTMILTIISGCGSKMEREPKAVEQPKPTPHILKPIATPQIDIKQEDPIEIARKSCLDKNTQGCIDFGWIMIEKGDYDLAKTAFDMAINLGDTDSGMRGIYFIDCIKEKNGKSCGLLGYLLGEGKGGVQDYKLAREFYQKAIDLGDTYYLGILAILYDNGLGGERSHFKATKIFEKVCNEEKDIEVRYANCYNTALAYEKGKGVRQNSFKAVKLYKKACNGGHADACNNLGWMYAYGKGVRQSRFTAQIYYGKACDMGSDLGCENYARNNR